MMSDHPSLRRDLLGGLSAVFAGALLIAVAGALIVVPLLPPVPAAAYLVLLVTADLAIFSWFATVLLRRRLLKPLDAVVGGVEAVADGAYDTRMPAADTREMARLCTALDRMAERLLSDQQTLADNIRSLDETNQLLTEARDAMIRTEKMASVGRLGAGIAHEVGNPLGAVMGYLALISRQVEGPLKEYSSAAEKEAQRIDRIIRGLLDYARPREASAQAVEVNAIVNDTIDLIRTQGHFSNVAIEFEQLDSPLVVCGDRYQLQQVLVNLLVNAADAIEGVAEAHVTVTAHRRRVRPLPVHTPARRRDDPDGVDYSHRRRLAASPRWPLGDPETESGEVVEIVVADNGPGLPPKMIDQVFEPFVTTKEPGKGTGLGLAVCARLVEGMGGVIRAGNATGGGAVFRVILPAMAAEVATT
jgi:two-component system, NtrC family, sensor kinase